MPLSRWFFNLFLGFSNQYSMYLPAYYKLVERTAMAAIKVQHACSIILHACLPFQFYFSGI